VTATAKRIVFVVFPDFQILDLTGPHEGWGSYSMASWIASALVRSVSRAASASAMSMPEACLRAARPACVH
jgi:hypothetical protein